MRLTVSAPSQSKDSEGIDLLCRRASLSLTTNRSLEAQLSVRPHSGTCRTRSRNPRWPKSYFLESLPGVHTIIPHDAPWPNSAQLLSRSAENHAYPKHLPGVCSQCRIGIPTRRLAAPFWVSPRTNTAAPTSDACKAHHTARLPPFS
jgi:hypothetical protein